MLLLPVLLEPLLAVLFMTFLGSVMFEGGAGTGHMPLVLLLLEPMLSVLLLPLGGAATFGRGAGTGPLLSLEPRAVDLLVALLLLRLLPSSNTVAFDRDLVGIRLRLPRLPAALLERVVFVLLERGVVILLAVMSPMLPLLRVVLLVDWPFAAVVPGGGDDGGGAV